MKTDDFRKMMMRGHGRCIAELRRADVIEKYRSSVMWACAHDITGGGADENTKEQYIYDMIYMFSDVLPFLKVAREHMDTQNCRLLSLFAADGNIYARDALWESYGKMLNARIFDENFNALCVCLTLNIGDSNTCIQNYVKIVRDISAAAENGVASYDLFADYQLTCEEAMGRKNVYKILNEIVKNAAGVKGYAEFFKTGEEKESISDGEEAGGKADTDDEMRTLPDETLIFIYENSSSPCERELAVYEMEERGMFTEELVCECLYDSNLNIREFARKKLNTQKRN